MTDKINLVIDTVNEIFLTFGCHCCFFILSLFVNNLWDCFTVIERQLQLSTQTYERIRKIVWLSLFFLLTFIGGNFGMSYFFGIKSSANLSILSSYYICAAKTWSFTILVWFFVLVSTAIVLFDVLMNRLKNMVEIGMNVKNLAGELIEWKEQHTLVNHFVSLINKSFGLILVIAFSHGFVTFITNFYRFISGLQKANDSSNALFLSVFIHQAVLLSFFIVVSYRLQSYGNKLSESVYKFKVPLEDLAAQNVLNSVLIQVIHANPKITAADVFDINLTLYPVILGTTLTYVIILLQSSNSSG